MEYFHDTLSNISSKIFEKVKIQPNLTSLCVNFNSCHFFFPRRIMEYFHDTLSNLAKYLKS